MRLQLHKRSAVELVSRIIPEAKRSGINDTFLKVQFSGISKLVK
jgi:hypothetical protein